MTRVYLTIDTELSVRLFQRDGRAGLERNYARSILGQADDGAVGILHQMDRLDAHGMKAVFFVDPMPGLVAGVDIVRRIVDPILERGHDVQLHTHTEWLAFADRSPVDGRTGGNIRDFSLTDQWRILATARDLLTMAGAPDPVAFRAGNYGANDDTLRALARLGIPYDSSFGPGVRQSACRIGLPATISAPIRRLGVLEVPVATIGGWQGRRHVQLTAISAWEMDAAIDHAVKCRLSGFSLVSHSFELMSRDRSRVNRIVARRFDRLCETLGSHDGARTATYRDDPPSPPAALEATVLPLAFNPLRTAARLGEQAISNHLYGENRHGTSRPAWLLREKLVNPLHHMVPLQNLAIDLIATV